MSLTDRKRRVLEAIIEDYIQTACPVGSRTLARKYLLGISPATIRNEMSDLEEMGFLEQPHTSAGRVPSDKGYRLYVDSLMEIRHLAMAEIDRIDELYRQRSTEVEHIIALTARVLSEMTSCLSLVENPSPESLSFRALQLMPYDDERALVVVMADGGFISHQLLDVPSGATAEELAYVTSILNRHLEGHNLNTLKKSIIDGLRSELDRYRKLVESLLEMLSDMVTSAMSERLVTGGAAQIMSQPEFRDVERLRNVLRAVECAQLAGQLLSGVPAGGSPAVMIGGEILLKDMHDCAMVVAPYRIGGRTVGRLAVLGPRRMEYGRVIAIVSRVAEVLSGYREAPPDRR